MRMSDIVAQYISEILEQSGGNAEIQRNELAQTLGCVPSQINYVITSRFTPEQGYLVESRRGGGGYIRITRVQLDADTALMHIVNSIGDTLDYTTARMMLQNMAQQGLLSEAAAALMHSALTEQAYAGVPKEYRGILRAGVLKYAAHTNLTNYKHVNR